VSSPRGSEGLSGVLVRRDGSIGDWFFHRSECGTPEDESFVQVAVVDDSAADPGDFVRMQLLGASHDRRHETSRPSPRGVQGRRPGDFEWESLAGLADGFVAGSTPVQMT
jgi:hypothetical protein